MSVLRLLVAICLAVVLAGTSGAMAVARGQMAAGPGVTLVICVGDGTETLRLDADGAPVAPAHACPDCVLVGFAPGHDRTAPPHPVRVEIAQQHLPVPPIPAASTPYRASHARAPPALV